MSDEQLKQTINKFIPHLQDIIKVCHQSDWDVLEELKFVYYSNKLLKKCKYVLKAPDQEEERASDDEDDQRAESGSQEAENDDDNAEGSMSGSKTEAEVEVPIPAPSKVNKRERKQLKDEFAILSDIELVSKSHKKADLITRCNELAQVEHFGYSGSGQHQASCFDNLLKHDLGKAAGILVKCIGSAKSNKARTFQAKIMGSRMLRKYHEAYRRAGIDPKAWAKHREERFGLSRDQQSRMLNCADALKHHPVVAYFACTWSSIRNNWAKIDKALTKMKNDYSAEYKANWEVL